MISRLIIAAVIGVLTILMVSLMVLLPMPDRAAEVSVSSGGPTIAQLEQLGQLAVLRIHVADVIEARDEQGWRGNVEGAWLLKGDALLAVDMAAAEIVDKDEQLQTARLMLPPPAVIQSRVDHEQTRTFRFHKGPLISEKRASSLRDHAMRQAQRVVDRTAHNEESIQQAREITATLLKDFYSITGWEVQVVWEDIQALTASETTEIQIGDSH